MLLIKEPTRSGEWNLVRNDGLIGAQIYKEADYYRRNYVSWYVHPVEAHSRRDGTPCRWLDSRNFRTKREAIAYAEEATLRLQGLTSVL